MGKRRGTPPIGRVRFPHLLHLFFTDSGTFCPLVATLRCAVERLFGPSCDPFVVLLTSAAVPGCPREPGKLMKLVVTIPAQNEQATIANVIAGVPRKIAGISDVEVIVVNDGSTDGTAEAAAAAGALVVTLHNRPGLGKVFKTGLE